MTATLTAPTHRVPVAHQYVEEFVAKRALNQLMSMTSGRDAAKATADLQGDPLARAKAIEALLEEQLRKATSKGDHKLINSLTIRLDSARSLIALAQLVCVEVDFDAF